MEISFETITVVCIQRDIHVFNFTLEYVMTKRCKFFLYWKIWRFLILNNLS